MSFAWNPEATVAPDLALKLIRTQFPELKSEKIKLLGIGWDNTAYLIDDHYVFRFPRRQIAVPLLATEFCLLPKIASKIPVSIPIPQWYGSAAFDYPWPFSGYQLLPGKTACSVVLSDSARKALAKPLARFLKALHAISLSDVEGCPVPEDRIGKLNVQRLATEIKKNLEQMILLNLIESRSKFDRIIQDSLHLKPAVASAIVHGDFYARHILLDEKDHLAGVIDWGDIHFGDPGVDLSVAHSFLSLDAQQEFCSEYGPISENSWLLGRLRALFSATLLTLYGHHNGDPIIKKEGIRILTQIS